MCIIYIQRQTLYIAPLKLRINELRQVSVRGKYTVHIKIYKFEYKIISPSSNSTVFTF